MLNLKIHKFHLILVIFTFVLIAMFFVNAEHYRARNQELKKTRSVVAGTKVADNQEALYAHPIPVHLNARVVGTFVGGRDLAVETEVAVNGHQQFYIVGYDDLDYSTWQGESVDIEGAIVGLTCAYANTVFGGNCVPEIMANQIIRSEITQAASDLTKN